MSMPRLSVSVVSHGQAALVIMLLNDFQKHCAGESLEVILTINVPEFIPDTFKYFTFPVKIIHNAEALGIWLVGNFFVSLILISAWIAIYSQRSWRAWVMRASA
jgi:hypothetical protein